MTDKVFKNIGKFKQWTGEKFGSAKTTLQTEDFQRLEVETERKRIQFEKLHAAVMLFQLQLGKKKPSPEDGGKSKRLPNDILGVCLSNYGNEFTQDGPLANALMNVGSAQSRLSHLQQDFAENQDYMDRLEEGLNQFKEFQQLRKKLESRRLDYDAKLARLQKSKKENPSLEQEMQAAKLKYEDSDYDVIQKMIALQDFEQVHCLALQQFVEIQFEYYQKSMEILQDVKSNWGSSSGDGGRNGLVRTLSHASDDVTTTALNIPPPRRPNGRSASFNSDYHQEMPMPSPSMRTPPPPPPPVLPRRQSQSNNYQHQPEQRKAIYEFGGENTDELSFAVGDIITVIEQVDEGWWIGEAYGRRGIFPVNYTESVSSSHGGPPTMPARPSLSSSISSYIAPVTEEPSPFTDENKTATTLSSSRSGGGGGGGGYTRPNQPLRTLSSNTSSPMNSPRPAIQQQTTTTTTKRAPPPPPPSSSIRTPPPPPTMKSNHSSTTTTRARTAPTTPSYLPVQQQQQDNYFDNAVIACGDCGCDEFVANVFKKGHCNNCFHKHF